MRCLCDICATCGRDVILCDVSVICVTCVTCVTCVAWRVCHVLCMLDVLCVVSLRLCLPDPLRVCVSVSTSVVTQMCVMCVMLLVV